MVHTVRSVPLILFPQSMQFLLRSERCRSLKIVSNLKKNENVTFKGAHCAHRWSSGGVTISVTLEVYLPQSVQFLFRGVLLFKFCIPKIKNRKKNIKWCAPCVTLILRRFNVFSHDGGISPLSCAILDPIGVELLFIFRTKAQKYKNVTFNGAHHAQPWFPWGATNSVTSEV